MVIGSLITDFKIKNNNMKNLILISAFALLLCSTNAQSQYSPAKGNECTLLAQSNLKTFATNVKALLVLAQQDKSAYGTTGAYAAAANKFYANTKNAYDSVLRTVKWLETAGDNKPERTTYAEAAVILQHMWGIMNNLEKANWWASISAIYHKSKHASCGKEKALELLTDALNILINSNRCYTGAYKEIPACK